MTTEPRCPCEGEDEDPGPHIASCPWNDPDYNPDCEPPIDLSALFLAAMAAQNSARPRVEVEASQLRQMVETMTLLTAIREHQHFETEVEFITLNLRIHAANVADSEKCGLMSRRDEHQAHAQLCEMLLHLLTGEKFVPDVPDPQPRTERTLRLVK